MSLLLREDVEAKPGEWHPLLQHEPEPVFEKDALHPWHVSFDPEKCQVHVDGADPCLLKLGAVSDPGYRLRVHISQHPWRRGVGFFLGLQPKVEYEKNGWQFQIIQLHGFAKAPGGLIPKDIFKIERWRAFARKVPEGFMINTWSRGADEVEGLTEECCLEIQVTMLGLTRAYWNGAQLSGITSNEWNSYFQLEDYLGDFGLYNAGSSCVHRDAEFMVERSKS